MGSAAAVVVVINSDLTMNTPQRSKAGGAWGTVVAAALALPGVYTPAARAESAPEHGVVALKYLQYQDRQPGLTRIKVTAPSLYVLAPLGTQWSIEGSLVADNVSGASPRWQSSVSSASVMHDERTAGDVKVTRYFDRASYGVGVSHSSENDYVSNALSLEGAWSNEDNNRTWNLGLGGASDSINPTKGGQDNVRDKKKATQELMLGVSQALSATDIAQLNLTLSQSKGYLNDPYKTLDVRPEKRTQVALLGRWNHHFEGNGTTLRSSYRYYRDSYRIDAHTLQLEWVKPFTQGMLQGLTVIPSLRYYTQSSASFYRDAYYDAAGYPVFPNLTPGQLNSGDHRVSAFGAVTLGFKTQYQITPRWSIDGKVERYEQRAAWRLIGAGSTGLEPFRATMFQLGVSCKF
jgi:Protein of unknown function (DUF3570)